MPYPKNRYANKYREKKGCIALAREARDSISDGAISEPPAPRTAVALSDDVKYALVKLVMLDRALALICRDDKRIALLNRAEDELKGKV